MNTIPTTTIGIIGCGQISSIYLQAPKKFPFLQILACADINMQRAHTQAQRFHIPKACTVDALLADPAISIVVNLTVPNVHSDITLAALAAGKHVYSEKPLALSREQGLALLNASEHANKRIGCAPDTFLGAGIQTCIKLINDGAIGTPLAATAFMMNHGPEHWHPDPHFFYQPGAGPLFDMGPYYLTALISLFGPVRRVTASTRISFPQRTITSSPLYGSTISVQTPTHLAGVLDFANDAVVTMITSFDVWSHHLPRLEIYGSHGSLLIPDPNTFGGPVLIRHSLDSDWTEMPLTLSFTDNCRGIGIADMASAIHFDQPHRANAFLAYHVLDIMHAFLDSSSQGKHINLTSTCERPLPLSPNTYDWVAFPDQ